MPLPATGWLPGNLNSNAPPEHWPLPVSYVGVYSDPSQVSDEKTTPATVVLASGDVTSQALLGFSTDEEAVELHLIQTGVFGIILIDSVEITVLVAPLAQMRYAPTAEFRTKAPRFNR